ncbi:MAG: dienelactone hydrolase family protein [Pyrinomonadaceae bacterium]
MSGDDAKQMEEARDKVSRRKFLGHTTGAGLVAAATTVATVAATQTGAKKTAKKPASVKPHKLAGKMIQCKSGDLMIPAYFSRAAKANAPAVLVIHEVFGLNDHIKSIADHLAAEGFNTLAPNLFVRAPQPPPKDASDVAALRKAVSSIPNDVAIRDMQAGLDYMKTVKNLRPRFASIGFCMGGGFSYQLATHTVDLAGAAIFYGRTPVELVPQVSCPLLGSFGELDSGIPAEKLKEFEDALSKAGKQADIKIYMGAKHGFFNDTRPEAYNAEAAADAWQRTLKFFHERLGA